MDVLDYYDDRIYDEVMDDLDIVGDHKGCGGSVFRKTTYGRRAGKWDAQAEPDETVLKCLGCGSEVDEDEVELEQEA